MALSLDKPKLDNLANEIWKSAERLRGKLKAYEYQNVVLPMIVIRRLEKEAEALLKELAQ
jgi:type I restriction enzyme M protein